MKKKLEFHLVPVSGTLKSEGGFRAEFKKSFRDQALHKLRLMMRPLSAFRVLGPKKDILPVNVSRIPQFRITSFTSADGLHGSHTVVFGQDIVVKGSNLTIDEDNGGFVAMNVNYSRGEVASRGVDAKIISHSDTEIRLAWPEDLDAEEARGQRLVFTVWKATRGEDMDKNRIAAAWIHFD